MQTGHQFTETDFLPVTGRPNAATAGNAALWVGLRIKHRGCGVPEPGCWVLGAVYPGRLSLRSFALRYYLAAPAGRA